MLTTVIIMTIVIIVTVIIAIVIIIGKLDVQQCVVFHSLEQFGVN